VWTDSTLLDDDIYRPQYHLSPSLFRMGEPNAPFYFNGKYHIFLQYHGTATPTGPSATSSGARWLHFVSEDMVNWEELPPAIIPEKNSPDYSHCFSGNAVISLDGTPYIFYSAIDLRKSRSGCIAFAKAKDSTDPYLTEWEKGGWC
jgi:sucrose-6-phosphate hydrolase SacC (GH32 family)